MYAPTFDRLRDLIKSNNSIGLCTSTSLVRTRRWIRARECIKSSSDQDFHNNKISILLSLKSKVELVIVEKMRECARFEEHERTRLHAVLSHIAHCRQITNDIPLALQRCARLLYRVKEFIAERVSIEKDYAHRLESLSSKYNPVDKIFDFEDPNRVGVTSQTKTLISSVRRVSGIASTSGKDFFSMMTLVENNLAKELMAFADVISESAMSEASTLSSEINKAIRVSCPEADHLFIKVQDLEDAISRAAFAVTASYRLTKTSSTFELNRIQAELTYYNIDGKRDIPVVTSDVDTPYVADASVPTSNNPLHTSGMAEMSVAASAKLQLGTLVDQVSLAAIDFSSAVMDEEETRDDVWIKLQLYKAAVARGHTALVQLNSVSEADARQCEALLSRTKQLFADLIKVFAHNQSRLLKTVAEFISCVGEDLLSGSKVHPSLAAASVSQIFDGSGSLESSQSEHSQMAVSAHNTSSGFDATAQLDKSVQPASSIPQLPISFSASTVAFQGSIIAVFTHLSRGNGARAGDGGASSTANRIGVKFGVAMRAIRRASSKSAMSLSRASREDVSSATSAIDTVVPLDGLDLLSLRAVLTKDGVFHLLQPRMDLEDFVESHPDSLTIEDGLVLLQSLFIKDCDVFPVSASATQGLTTNATAAIAIRPREGTDAISFTRPTGKAVGAQFAGQSLVMLVRDSQQADFWIRTLADPYDITGVRDHLDGVEPPEKPECLKDPASSDSANSDSSAAITKRNKALSIALCSDNSLSKSDGGPSPSRPQVEAESQTVSSRKSMSFLSTKNLFPMLPPDSSPILESHTSAAVPNICVPIFQRPAELEANAIDSIQSVSALNQEIAAPSDQQASAAGTGAALAPVLKSPDPKRSKSASRPKPGHRRGDSWLRPHHDEGEPNETFGWDRSNVRHTESRPPPKVIPGTGNDGGPLALKKSDSILTYAKGLEDEKQKLNLRVKETRQKTFNDFGIANVPSPTKAATRPPRQSRPTSDGNVAFIMKKINESGVANNGPIDSQGSGGRTDVIDGSDCDDLKASA